MAGNCSSNPRIRRAGLDAMEIRAEAVAAVAAEVAAVVVAAAAGAAGRAGPVARSLRRRNVVSAAQDF